MQPPSARPGYRTSATRIGDSPIEGSWITSASVSTESPRAISSIFCSPPEQTSTPGGWPCAAELKAVRPRFPMRPRQRNPWARRCGPFEVMFHRKLVKMLRPRARRKCRARSEFAQRRVGDIRAIEMDAADAAFNIPKMVLKAVDLPAPFQPITVGCAASRKSCG